MELYKGYIRLSGKKSTDKIKDVPASSFRTLENAKTLKSYGGVLADDTILIDLDDSEQSEILMNIVEDLQLDCKVIQTTRGKHFLFKNTSIDKCYTHVNLACGLVADIKVGCKTSYEVLKVDDAERFVEWDIEEGQEYQKVPMWLHPVKSNIDFVGMDAGDGRNQSLFNYILTLQSNGFSKEESREVIDVINQYVLKEPLSDDEIKTVTRDDAFKKELFFVKNTFQHDKFGNYLISNHHIVKVDGKLHIYQDGTYHHDMTLIEKSMLKVIPNLTDAKRKEVIKYLNVMCVNVEPAPVNLIAFRNGILNIDSMTLLPFSSEYIITNRIPWDYNPTAYSEIADTTLSKITCQDDEIRSLIEECIGYTFYRKNIIQKGFILIGDKSNGKSTFIGVLNRILGDENVSALDLKNLGDRFTKATLFKKLANIGDDISDEFIPDASLFKKITSGDRIQAEFKGTDLFEFNPYVKLIFSANNMPRIKDKTGAVLRRLIIIPFNAKFSEDDHDYDPQIKSKLCSQTSIEYFIKIGLDGLKRVLDNRKFSKSGKVQKELDEYEEYNNPVIGFFKEQDEGYIFKDTINEVYLHYTQYCNDNGYMPESKIQFGKTVKAMFNVKNRIRTVAGKSVRMYESITKNE